jgi:GNAT superfamily N-acetyltransferase
VFDETFDDVEARFPDLGTVELHEDEAAGSDNGAGSERQFAYCKEGSPLIIAFAPKAEGLPDSHLRGLMRHEFGHAMEYRYGVKALEEKLGRKLPEQVERRADAIAEAIWGEPIEYDEAFVQCVGVGGVHPRPRHLPDKKEKLRANGLEISIVEVDTGAKNAFEFEAHTSTQCLGYIKAHRTVASGRVIYVVDRIHVDEEWRRRGVGTKLYEAAAAEACRRRGVLASLERDPNAHSHDFWFKQYQMGRAEILGERFRRFPRYALRRDDCPSPVLSNPSDDSEDED